MIKPLRYLCTGDGYDYFTDDLADAQRHVGKWGGVIYERMRGDGHSIAQLPQCGADQPDA